jgi:hypothetical protein
MAKRPYRKAKLDYLKCRTVGHSWDNISGNWRPKVTYIHGTRMTFRCERCGMLRYEVWSNATGELIYRAYDAPEGYAMSRDDIPEGMTMRQLMRVEWAARERSKNRKVS